MDLSVSVLSNKTLVLSFFSHIMEHLEGVIDKPEKDMSPQELQLHYFKMHDYDGNNLLDGLELATAITHVHREVGQSLYAACLPVGHFSELVFVFLSPGERRRQPANERGGPDCANR